MFLLGRKKNFVRITGASMQQGKTILDVVDRDGNTERRIVDGPVDIDAMRENRWIEPPGVPHPEPLVVESVDKSANLEEIFSKVNSVLGPYGVRIHTSGIGSHTCYFHAERIKEE